jgi:hypothetical protein
MPLRLSRHPVAPPLVSLREVCRRPPALLSLLFLLAVLVPRCALAAPPPQHGRARALVERTIANQHRNDAAIYDYERVEHRLAYDGQSISSDETYRLVPTGTGRLSLLVARGDQPVDLAFYRKQLRNWREVLTHAINPDDPRQVRSKNQQRKKDKERAGLINAIGHAFRFTWLDEEVEGGRTLARIALDPDPGYHPTSRKTEVLRHVRATVWIDVRSAQLVRGEATIISDISAGGGIVSKIYRGGWFRIEQAEVEPGIWFPTRMEFSIRGRMFFFGFQEHKLTVTSRYHYVGTPRQALLLVRRELASGKPFPADH